MIGERFAQLVHISADSVTLEGMLVIPVGAPGVVLFAHGSGSSRHSPRNTFVAEVLQRAGLGTLLIDLLSKEEDVSYEARFDIQLLADRLMAATRWLNAQPPTRDLGIGYFGASTGAAAALQAAAALGSVIRAVVSRGGRPDLAWQSLERVHSPTLLIVGGDDTVVIELNQRAYARLQAEKQLVIIPGATHLFEEPGTLAEVARLAAAWFSRYLTPQTTRAGERPQRHS
jgi:dienelactone hydrolase